MKINDLPDVPELVGVRIRVTAVAKSQLEDAGMVNDTERLLGQTGTIERFLVFSFANFSQLVVRWDDPNVGSLMLVGDDEVELFTEVKR